MFENTRKVLDKFESAYNNVQKNGWDVSKEDEKTISLLHSILNDFYREVEIADNMMKYTKSTLDNNLRFSEKVYNQINELKEKLVSQYDRISELYNTHNKEYLCSSDIALIGVGVFADLQRLDTNKHVCQNKKTHKRADNAQGYLYHNKHRSFYAGKSVCDAAINETCHDGRNEHKQVKDAKKDQNQSVIMKIFSVLHELFSLCIQK